MLIDELENEAHLFSSSGTVEEVSPKDAHRAREDWSRMAGPTGSYMVYRIPGPINSLQVDFFITDRNGETDVRLQSGDTTESFSPLVASKDIFEPLKNDYGMYPAVRLVCRDIPSDHRFVKVILARDTQLSRIEVSYGPSK